MRKQAVALTVLLLLTLSLFSSALQVQATAHRRLVVPDQFSTISIAIRNATDGDTIYVKSGTYSESELKINKAITIIGENAWLNLQSERHKETMPGDITGLFTSTWYSRALEVNTSDFTLSGFTVTTSGGDINITGDRSRVMGNSIRADLTVKGSSVTVTENTLRSTSYGITILGNNCNISNNQVDCSLNIYGQRNICSFNKCGSLNIVTDDSYIYSNTLQGNEHSYGNFGISGDNNIISRNTISHVSYGLKIGGVNNLAMFNNISNCGVGLMPSANNTLYGNTVENTIWAVSPIYQIVNAEGNRSVMVHNNIYSGEFIPLQGVLTPPYTRETMDYYDNGVDGNYWSSYRGTDADGDGIGDIPFYLDPHHIDRHPLMAPFNLSTAAEIVPDWLLTPTVRLINPQSDSVSAIKNVTLEFATNKPTSWIGYSLDGQENVTISGNLTITDLAGGLHNLTVYSRDNYGKETALEPVTFKIELPTQFPFWAVALVPAVALVVVVAFVVFYKRRGKK